MKNHSSTINLKLMLTLGLVCFSALGFSQFSDKYPSNANNAPEIEFEFLGKDLLIQPPPEYNDLIGLAGNNPDPVLKTTAMDPTVLDSIDEVKSYGFYLDRLKWYFNYDSNNRLKSSFRLFIEKFSTPTDCKEVRDYDEAGLMVKMLRIDFPRNRRDSLLPIYSEQNQYLHGNLVKQNIIENSGFGIYDTTYSYYRTNSFSYNENNQLVKMENMVTNGEKLYSEEFIYDSDHRTKYRIFKYGSGSDIYLTKNEYEISDSTLSILTRTTTIYNNKLLLDLDQITKWQNGNTYLLKFDSSGRTISIESSTYDLKRKIKYFNFKVDYAYTSTGKASKTSYFLPDDQINFTKWNCKTIMEFIYTADDKLLEYEKTFYDASNAEWALDEKKTYYYTSAKSAVTSANRIATGNAFIYPNPATDFIRLSISPQKNSSYIICNQLGAVVAKGIFNNPEIPVSRLNPGIYILKIEMDGVGLVNRFIKK